jgi:hypothetical protein
MRKPSSNEESDFMLSEAYQEDERSIANRLGKGVS